MSRSKLTIKELLDQKERIRGKRQEKARLYIESFDSEIIVKMPSSALIAEAQSHGEEDATEADIYLVYNCTVEPNLKSEELQKGFDCIVPTDIVEALFLPGEIAAIAGELMKLAGFGTQVNQIIEKTIDNVKN